MNRTVTLLALVAALLAAGCSSSDTASSACNPPCPLRDAAADADLLIGTAAKLGDEARR
jgi:outer membrane lipoprotein SlyB